MSRWIRTLANRFALYLRGRFASRSHFGGQFKRATIRIPRRTVKPSLETLGDRVMPSATPAMPMQGSLPVVYQASPPAPDTSSAVDQWTHLVSIVQNKISSAEAALSQEVNQVTAYVVQR